LTHELDVALSCFSGGFGQGDRDDVAIYPRIEFELAGFDGFVDAGQDFRVVDIDYGEGGAFDRYLSEGAGEGGEEEGRKEKW
jgi:hypothetical protein